MKSRQAGNGKTFPAFFHENFRKNYVPLNDFFFRGGKEDLTNPD